MNNEIPTTVKGDPEKIDALKKMGHGMISHAFRVGCDIVLGISSDKVEQLKSKKKELERNKTVIEGELEQIDLKIQNLQKKETQLRLAAYEENEKLEQAISEYKRCAPKIIFENRNMLCSHLAELTGWVAVSDIKEFFAGRSEEPTEIEIREFLEKHVV